MNKNLIVLLGVCVVMVFICSCQSSKNIAYFKNLPDTLVNVHVKEAKFNEPIIQPDDILNISIQTVDPSAAESVNQKSIDESAVGASSTGNIGNQEISGILVDKNGEIEMPIIGTIKLAGLTTYKARQLIKTKASAYFVKPSVQVRFANFKITVIGEVNKPATYTLPNEKVTVLDALGLAGDLTIYGKRENLLLIRETGNGEKEFVRFSLNSTELFNSPYYYLRQNDVIYVEPNKSKVASTDAARNRSYAILTSVLSAITLVIVRFF